MEKLNFPPSTISLKNKENKPYIFDPIRKKWLLCTPEEWVRIHSINYLIDFLAYPASWLRIEYEIRVYQTIKRIDLLVVHPEKGSLILVECKAPSVKIDQKVFDQIARYNLEVKSKYMMLTNGLNHYFCSMDDQNKRYSFIETLPKFSRT
jgi:hypothetical protein